MMGGVFTGFMTSIWGPPGTGEVYIGSARWRRSSAHGFRLRLACNARPE